MHVSRSDHKLASTGMTSAVRNISAVILISKSLLFSPSSASDSVNKYNPEDLVMLWVNKVGPYNNPQETYSYYSLTFCHQDGNAAHKWGGLGEVLGGNKLIDSQIKIKFGKNVDRTIIFDVQLDACKVKQFKGVIENSYWIEFFMACSVSLFM